MKETMVEKQMRLLKISREEAEKLVEYDKSVDKMTMKELNADLTKEQKQAMKQATKCKKKPVNYKFDSEKSKNRKKDDEKNEIITKVNDFLSNFVENSQIVNAEREISFKIGENSYSLTLTKHRNKSEN